jgi:uncharacterized membrane protein YeaQ/YmgE (transglycosylase-associated protein family)
MPINAQALINLLIIVLIGIIAALVLGRYRHGRLSRAVAMSRQIDVTASLVGIAGAFIGFQIGVVLELVPLPLLQFLLAAVGALLVLWLWRGR